MSQPSKHGVPWWLGASLLTCCLALVYFPVLSAPFVWTDHAEIVQGALVPKSAAEFWAALVQPKGEAKSTERQQYMGDSRKRSSHAYHRPIKAFSYGLDHALGGGQAWAFHLSNLIFHLLCALLLLFLARHLFARSLPGLAELLALWHALNPLHTETAAWISARSDSLMSLLILCALGLQLAAREAKTWAWPMRFGSALCLLAAVGTKESGLVGLGLILLLAFFLPAGHSRLRRIAQEASLPVLALAGALVWRFEVVGDLHLGRMATRAGLNFWTGLDLLGRNLQQCILPFGHGVADTLAWIEGPSAYGLFAIVSLGAWAALAWRLRRSAPLVAAAWLAWLGAILPVSQLMPLLHARGDRYLYLPAIFTEACLAAAALWLWQKTASRRLLRMTLATVAALGLLAAAAISHLDGRDWRDEGRLFARAVAREPRCAECWNNLAYHEALQGRLPQALAASLQGLAVDRSRVRTARDGFSLRFILAQAALGLSRPVLAAQSLQEIHLKAGAAPATLRLLARAYDLEGRQEEARLLEAWADAGRVPAWGPEPHRVFSCRP